MNLTKIFSELTTTLDKLDQRREEILPISRSVIRDCSNAIKCIHRKEFDIYKEKILIIKSNHEKLMNLVNAEPGVFKKFLKTPEQEYAEAVTFYSIVTKQELPTPSELNIDPLNYAFGLADTIGELRRFALDNIRNSQLSDLNQILEDMDDIYTILVSMDFTDALTFGLRRATDVTRGILEKTRGDLTVAVRQRDLEQKLDRVIEEMK